MTQLALFLFGSPRLERDGIQVNVDTRKAIALIAYLAITRQRHSRDALAALLWPDYDQPHARATLRRTLSALNKALAGQWLEIDRDTIALDRRSPLLVDVDEFHSHIAECQTHHHAASEICSACVKPLAEAVAAYTGDFMAGFNLNDSSTFDDWQFYQSDTLRRELANALERLVRCYSALANFETAIIYARRWLALDRLHEPAHRTLMELYTWSGQRTAALHQYQECVEILEEELGVAPLEATTELYKAIKTNRMAPPPVQTLVPAPVPSQDKPTVYPTEVFPPIAEPARTVTGSLVPVYPFVGRATEWETIVKAYQDRGSGANKVLSKVF